MIAKKFLMIEKKCKSSRRTEKKIRKTQKLFFIDFSLRSYLNWSLFLLDRIPDVATTWDKASKQQSEQVSNDEWTPNLINSLKL